MGFKKRERWTNQLLIKKLLAVFVALLLSSHLAHDARAEDILIAAAASLTDVLKEIGIAYESKRPYQVHFTFGSSSALARQIEVGAPADVFFSADPAQMDRLEREGRVETGTRKNLLSNQLVMIVPAGSRLNMKSPRDLLKPEVKKIALAEPTSVPVGVYSRKYLENEGLWKHLQPKIVPVFDVRATLAAVGAANVDAGFVYKTDAALSSKVNVVYAVPFDKGPKIAYPIAMVKQSKHKAVARDFLSFVLSSAGKEAFKNYGFVIIEP